MKRTTLLSLAITVCLMPLALTQAPPTPPAPTVDRVGFPTAYQNWPVLYVYDRPDNKSVRTIYANLLANNVQDGEQWNYPYGSILVMQTWACLKDTNTECILDPDGRFQKDPAATPTLFVMRKEKGFGAAYIQNQTGEWEYVAYRPDGTYQTTPQNSFSCAVCHLDAKKINDWTFRTDLHIYDTAGAVPGMVMKSYRFLPSTLHVKPGTVLTVINDDGPAHTITDDFAGGMDTGRMKSGKSVSIRFTVPGEFNFHCSIHPSMKGKVIVDPE
jgi:plastocyanin